jgi:hypothetical protein
MWFVPTGCLTLIGLVVGFVALIVMVVFGTMKSSDVYKDSLRRAQNDPAVIAALGSPVEDGWFMTGKTEVNGSSGQADLMVPISGPKGKAKLYIVAEKAEGKWNYSKLVVVTDEGEKRLDMLSGDALEQ